MTYEANRAAERDEEQKGQLIKSKFEILLIA
jgi:hypothetical protein